MEIKFYGGDKISNPINLQLQLVIHGMKTNYII